jgi:hypothetical protein
MLVMIVRFPFRFCSRPDRGFVSAVLVSTLVKCPEGQQQKKKKKKKKKGVAAAITMALVSAKPQLSTSLPRPLFAYGSLMSATVYLQVVSIDDVRSGYSDNG